MEADLQSVAGRDSPVEVSSNSHNNFEPPSAAFRRGRGNGDLVDAMSDTGAQHTPGSSEHGLTFVRPLPEAVPAPVDDDPTFARQLSLGIADRLFPPRALEESGSLPTVTGLELGHFVIEERIGRGGMGAVYRALDSRLDRTVALKVLDPHSSDPEAIQRFQNEARAAARLDHDNIARVHYIGAEQGMHFIAFEFVTGTNVRNFIVQKGKLAPSDAVNYTLQVAEALRHTAAENVVHRDIKPSNIIISPTGRAKLVDLGLARRAAAESSRDLTSAGTALGTFDYIAPEQALDARNVDVRSDIYSLGCTLYHMLTGEPPYPTGTMFQKVINHHRPVPPDPAEKNPRVSPQLSRIVRKMMASNPDERYASPDGLVADLLEVADALGLEPTYPDSIVWKGLPAAGRSRQWEGTRTWLAVAVVLLLLVLAERLLRSSLPPTNLVPEPRPNATSSAPQNAPIPPSTSARTPAQSSPTNASAGTATVARSALTRSGTDSSGQSRRGQNPPATTSSIRAASPQGRTPLPAGAGTNSGAVNQPPPLPPSNPSTNGVSDAGRISPPPLPLPPLQSGPAVPSEPFVVMTPGSKKGLIRCATLVSACQLAQDHQVIEIQAGGLITVPVETLEITNKHLHIRSDESSRPRLRFETTVTTAPRSLTRMTEIIRIERGSLELSDLDLELVVDSSSISDWALVSLANGSEFSAQGVSFTVVNAGRMSSVLFQVPKGDVTEVGDEGRNVSPRLVSLTDCVCRGELDFALQRNVQSNVSLELANVALAISGALLRVDGSDAYVMAMEPMDGSVTSLSLTHVTAVTGEGVLSASSGDHGMLPQLKLDISDCVFRVDRPDQPLAELLGHEEYELLRERLQVNENRDPSFYQLVGPLCVIESTTSLLANPIVLTPEQFGVNGVHLVTANLLALPKINQSTRMHQIQPSDLFLHMDRANPAFGSASDRQDAGVNWKFPRLPRTLLTVDVKKPVN